MTFEDLPFCRLCLNTSNLVSMFSGKSRKCRDDFRKIIQESLNIAIEQHDATTTVCLNCLIDVTYFHLFKLHCLQNGEKLKSLETTSTPKRKKLKSQSSPVKTLPIPDLIKTEEAFDWLKSKRSTIEISTKPEDTRTYTATSTQTIQVTTIDKECQIGVKNATQSSQTSKYNKNTACQTELANLKHAHSQTSPQRAVQVKKKVYNEGTQTPHSEMVEGACQTDNVSLNSAYTQTSQKSLVKQVYNECFLGTEKKDKSVQTEESKWFIKKSDDKLVKTEMDVKLLVKKTEKMVESETTKTSSEKMVNGETKSLVQEKDTVNGTVLEWLGQLPDDTTYMSPQRPKVPKEQRKKQLIHVKRSLFTPKSPSRRLKNGESTRVENITKPLEISVSSQDDVKVPAEQVSPSTSTISPGLLLKVNPTKSTLVEICYWCGKTLYNKREIKMHEKTHTQCRLCKKKFRNVQLAMAHLAVCKMKVLTKDPDKVYVDLVRLDHMEDGVREQFQRALEAVDSI